MKQPPFATLEPSPRFEHVIQARGGHGERVSEPKELMPALERALKVVKEEKRQALRQRLPRSQLRQDELGRHWLGDRRRGSSGCRCRPMSGSLIPEPLMPKFRLRMLSSRPSMPLAERPSTPPSESCTPRPLGAREKIDVPSEVLADRGRRQVDAELGHRAADPGGEGVGVRPRPERVFVGVRIALRRLVDALDQLVHAGAALVGVELRLVAEPARIRIAVTHHHRGIGLAQAPADHLVDRPFAARRSASPPPRYARRRCPSAPGARAVDLHHRLRAPAPDQERAPAAFARAGHRKEA
mgnify:CR=1 FL=1